MNSCGEALAHSLTISKSMLHRFSDDLKPQEYLHRPTPRANCVAWLIGHLAISDRRTLVRLGVEDLPTLPEDFEKRFSRDEGCPQAGEFGDVSILLPIFDSHREKLIETVKKASNEQLNKPLEKTTPMFKSIGEMVNFMALHSAMHAGQITIIRRSLGRPPLI